MTLRLSLTLSGRVLLMAIVLPSLIAALTACQPLLDVGADREGSIADGSIVESAIAGNESAIAGDESAIAAQGLPALMVVTPAPFAPLPVATMLPSSPAEQTISALVNRPPAPVRLMIPGARMDVAIEVMPWETTRVNGERTTRWVLPNDAAGWQVESAAAGEAGNMILMGRQLAGGVFAPIAQSAVQVGQEIHLYDDRGTLHRYRIDEVSAPLPIEGDTESEAQIAAYLAPAGETILTLITGWPDFTTTHRIFVRASLQTQP